MAGQSQKRRTIALGTPLGDDVLLLDRVHGREGIGELFQYTLDLRSEKIDIAFRDIVGQNVTVRLEMREGNTRYFNGYINQFEFVSKEDELSRYRATMVPWLWMLTRRQNCRIFQDKPVPAILKDIFSEHGFTDVELRLSASYRKWEYCVQYRESDFNFVSRLMEQEGIYYYFTHENGAHTLVLCDTRSNHDPAPGYDEVQHSQLGQSGASEVKGDFFLEQVWDWRVRQAVQPGKFAHTDFNFTSPNAKLTTQAEADPGFSNGHYEVFEFPGQYGETADGDHYAQVRIEELAAQVDLVSANSDARGLRAGHLFSLKDHPRKDQNTEHLIISTTIHATSDSYNTDGKSGAAFECSFEALPERVQYRSPRRAIKPVVEGPQTAIISGPPGEEIYPDKYGRVKAQFHWDRYGKRDENSSCWMRVSQVHAGIGFGGIDLPRINEEVIVSFIEGDPDQPIITGRVYNGAMMPPFELPGGANVAGYKSQTVKGGGYNELSLNDSDDGQGIVMHGQKDMNKTIENDDNTTVMNNQSNAVGVDRSASVGNNENLIVGNNREKTVNTNETSNIGVNSSTTIGADRATDVGANDKLTVGANRTVDISANEKTAIGSAKTETVGSMSTETVGTTKALSIGAAYQTTVGGVMNTSVGISMTEQVGVLRHTIAGSKIILQCGGSKIVMESGGKVTISGSEIAINAKGPVKINGATIDLN